MELRSLPCGAVAISLIMCTSLTGDAALLADLRRDYDTPSTAFVAGQTAAGRIPDTFGTGSWNFFGRSTAAPGGSETALVYSTTVNSVRDADAFVLAGVYLDLPAVSNSQLILGNGEGDPAADELALHPGNPGFTAQHFLLIRWTAGMGEAGIINFTGAARDLGVMGDGITFSIYNSTGSQLFNTTTTSGGTPIEFDFDSTVAAGQSVDFVIGANGNFNADHSAIKISINSIVPEPGSITLGLAAAALFIGRRKRG